MDIAEFHQYLSKFQTAYQFPVHVSRRLYALVGNEKPVFADVAVNRKGWDGLDGEVIVFTASRVARAVLSKSPNGEIPPGASSFSVDVEVWPRRALTRMTMNADETSYVNADYDWSQEYEGNWPRNARVKLHYREREAIELPLGEPGDTVHTGLRSHLHSLGEDLAASAG